MRWLYHIPIVLSAIILFARENTFAQNSLIQSYPQLTADSVLIVAPFPSLTDSGYVVKDMQLVGNVCWFAGYKWKDTGEPYYLPGGGVTTLVTYKAFVGKYNVTDVLNGSGNYGIIEIDALHHIERLAVVDKNVTAIGVTSSGERRLVELARKTILTMEYYTLKIEESSSPHEVFMDVVAAGNKVVVLSRFKNTWGFIRSSYWFGLRYGDAGNMQTTTSPVRIYDVYDALDWRLGFPSVHPVRLAATGNGNGVVMAYIAQRNDNPNTLLGKYVLFHIASENASTADVFINDTTIGTGHTDLINNAPCKEKDINFLLTADPATSQMVVFKNHSYTATNASRTTTCSTGNQ